ncbi:hypothetical protein BY447_3368 [Pantoea sp. JKS000250]|nr:hypothetical protein BY447_3368 [Pantoea sp. JKS000250]
MKIRASSHLFKDEIIHFSLIRFFLIMNPAVRRSDLCQKRTLLALRYINLREAGH